MGLFRPRFEGQLTLDRVPEDMTTRIQHRLEQGLLMPGHRGPRTDYRVKAMDSQAITFASHGLLTTCNVGLNDVTVRRNGPNQVQYDVSYWGWTLLAVAYSALLGLLFLALYLFIPQMRHDVHSYPYGPLLFWSIVSFFCLVWPWILSALHRGPAEGALQRILRETLSS